MQEVRKARKQQAGKGIKIIHSVRKTNFKKLGTQVEIERHRSKALLLRHKSKASRQAKRKSRHTHEEGTQAGIFIDRQTGKKKQKRDSRKNGETRIQTGRQADTQKERTLNTGRQTQGSHAYMQKKTVNKHAHRHTHRRVGMHTEDRQAYIKSEVRQVGRHTERKTGRHQIHRCHAGRQTNRRSEAG